jgi:hypothetical protein
MHTFEHTAWIRGLGKIKSMHEYIIGESELWSLFDKSMEYSPSLIYSFLFSLCKIYHLPPLEPYLSEKISQNFFTNRFRFPSTPMDASECHLFALSAS